MNQAYSGALKGTITIEYLMTTFPDERSIFFGFEEFVGKLEGQTGSFLLQHKRTHEYGVAKSEFEFVPYSGTGELEGISGSGH